jgi:hypothetical protein
LVPKLLGTGHVGLTSWSLEQRLTGGSASSVVGSLLERCVEFLANLFRLGEAAPATVSSQATVVEDVLPPDRQRSLRALARWIDAELADLPRGFAHGDFWAGNLLVHGNQLTGVVDWEAGNPSSLPAMDFFHLHLLAGPRPDIYQWGPAIVDHLLPLMRARGDLVTRGYLARLSIDPQPTSLEALVAAYWLERVGYHLATYLERRTDVFWIERNVMHVLDALAPS